MKKNSGVSMISLVITIIVIIILAAVAFGSSTDTIENANFSNFTNNVAEVQSLLDQQAVTLKGNEGKNGVSRTDAQVYNYLAKGATLVGDTSGEHWLSRKLASQLACTQLSGEAMKTVIDYALPSIKVSTDGANGVNCSYFVTNTGKVFVWPPYVYQNELYVNGDTKLPNVKADAAGAVYSGDYKFTVANVEVQIDAAAAPTSLSDADFDAVDADIFYTDGTDKAPMGVEWGLLYTGNVKVD